MLQSGREVVDFPHVAGISHSPRSLLGGLQCCRRRFALAILDEQSAQVVLAHRELVPVVNITGNPRRLLVVRARGFLDASPVADQESLCLFLAAEH